MERFHPFSFTWDNDTYIVFMARLWLTLKSIATVWHTVYVMFEHVHTKGFQYEWIQSHPNFLRVQRQRKYTWNNRLEGESTQKGNGEKSSMVLNSIIPRKIESDIHKEQPTQIRVREKYDQELFTNMMLSDSYETLKGVSFWPVLWTWFFP